MNQREFWRLIAEIDVAQLESGDDRVVLMVLEGEKSDSPTSRRSAPTSVEVEKDRARSARHYLKEYQRQRAGLDKRIRDLETVIASEAKKTPLRRHGRKG